MTSVILHVLITLVKLLLQFDIENDDDDVEI